MHSLGPQMVMLASVLWAGINFLVVRWVVSLLHKNKLTYATLVFLWIVAAVEVSQSRLLSLPVLLFIRCRIPNANLLRVTTILEVPNETCLWVPQMLGPCENLRIKRENTHLPGSVLIFLGTLWAQRLTRFSRKELFYLVVLIQSWTGTEKP